MSSPKNPNVSTKPKSHIASKIPTSGRDSGTHSRSSSVSNLTTASDIHSEIGDPTPDSAEDFKIDDRVWVNGSKPGCVKFLGKTQFAPGIWAGVLLDEPVGKNDGSVAGIKYFSCEPLKGIFARPGKLTRTPGAVSNIGDSAMVGVVTPKSSSVVPSSRASVCSNTSATSPKYPKLKVGDRITVSSLSGLKTGILRFIGETDFAKGEWAGIELDEPSGKNDGSVAGKRYFSCQTKYGLFAPLHKLSRPGMTTPVSRPGSARGTCLMRSNSRESMNSSISNSSRVSRVKLGVTSLTSAQKTKVSGTGITTATKALQEALKEKEQHIEQLLKERDFDRAEFARLTTHFEEIDNKSSDLEKKQKISESEKKSLEEHLNSVQRKLEDIQFQLEEEKIAKSDFEAQFQQKNMILKQIEVYLSKESDAKFIEIKKLLGQETIYAAGEVLVSSGDSNEEMKKIAELEATIKQITKEKQEMSSLLTELQRAAGERSKENETRIKDLNTTVQERDDMIANLKNELNCNIEKVTLLIENNKDLSEQILQKEEQAKGHADDVIKELGETINSLKDELKTKCSQLAEHVASIQDKDKNIAALELSLNGQAATLLELENEFKNVSSALKQKESETEEKFAVQKSLEEEIVALKSQLETDNDYKKKINLLEEEIKSKSCTINDFLSSIEEKENLISSLQRNFDSHAAALSQLETEKKDLNESLKQKDSELLNKTVLIKSLEEQIAILTEHNESAAFDKEKKMLDLVKEIEHLSNCVQEKEDLLLKTKKELCDSQSSIETLNMSIQQLSEKVQQSDLNLSKSTKDAEEKIKGLQAELSSLTHEKSDYEKKMLDYVKEIELLTNSLKEKENQLLKTQGELDESLKNIETLRKTIEQLTEKIEQTDLNLSTTSKDAAEQINKLENELITITKEKLNLQSKYQKEVDVFKTTIKVQEDEIQAKSDSVAQYESQIALLTEKLKNDEEKISALNKEIETLTEKNGMVSNEIEKSAASLKEKDEVIADLTKQIENMKKTMEKNNLTLEQSQKQLQLLQDSLNTKEQENNQLISKLQLAEQNVEMLNKDSSEHVMSLQNELIKVKEESTSIKTHLEQELTKTKKEKEQLSNLLKEKDALIVEKEDALANLEKKMKEKASELSGLFTQNAELLQNISLCSSAIEEAQRKHEEKLSITLSEYETKLSQKEQQLLTLKNEVKNLFSANHAREDSLLEKDKFITELQDKLNLREMEINKLSAQNEELLKNIARSNADFEKEQRIYNDKLSSSSVDFDNRLKEKDQVIQDVQSELTKYKELLDSKTKELGRKEGEINVLKNIVNEKDSQFDELTQMVQSSQNQLTLLVEKNEKNESLLKSKESFIRDFKTDQEQQLLILEQSFKEKVAELEKLVEVKDDEIKVKQSECVNLQSEIENNRKLVEGLQKELETAKTHEKERAEQSTNSYEELNNRIADMELKYNKLLEEKEKIAKEELQAREAKNSLESVRDTLLQEKSVQEQLVKDREAKLEALQAEVNRMQAEFSLHKQELQRKIDVSQVEIEAALELKTQLDLQHSVLEELQQDLQKSDEKCKKLEAEVQSVSFITSEKNKLQAQVDDFQKLNVERSEMISKMEEKYRALEEQLENYKNLMFLKENELSSLKDQIQKLPSDKSPDDSMSLSVKSLEEENLALKNKITLLELHKKPDSSEKSSKKELSAEEVEERESLLSQVDFLNSIIVDMKQKNEELTQQLNAQSSFWEENDVNLNETKKVMAPRLFCDICDMFDLHDTEDCPKQESYAEEEIPQFRRAGSRQFEERPYCNNCEVFGHWTLDCEEPETF